MLDSNEAVFIGLLEYWEITLGSGREFHQILVQKINLKILNSIEVRGLRL
jgi:hypothetical protein